MNVIDATRDHSRPLWRAWRRRLHGAIARTLISSSPRETWRKELPALLTAAEAARRAALQHEMHQHRRDPDPAWLDETAVLRVDAEEYAGATMMIGRAVYILGVSGIDRDRAMRLCADVGPAVVAALAWLDVVDVVMLGDEGARGAA